MDPLSIATTVTTITRFVLLTANDLYSLRERYRNASSTIIAIHTESNVICTSLGLIQGILWKESEDISNRLSDQPGLIATFDAALTGCTLVYSCLDEEVRGLMQSVDSKGRFGKTAKAKYIWKEDMMQGLLRSIRGQHSAIMSLIQCLQVFVILFFYYICNFEITPLFTRET
jgi:hypothetical protein